MSDPFTPANATLVLPDRLLTGGIRVEDGLIADIFEGGAIPGGATDCRRDYVLPGLIALHTDNLERHIEPRARPDASRSVISCIFARKSARKPCSTRWTGSPLRTGSAHEAGAVAAARRYGAVLASHDDSTREQVAVSAGNGVQFAEFPTTRDAAEACRDADIAVMMGAPNLVRGGSHSGNVSAQDLAQAGLLDILSSDYVPAALLLSAFRLADLWQDVPRARW